MCLPGRQFAYKRWAVEEVKMEPTSSSSSVMQNWIFSLNAFLLLSWFLISFSRLIAVSKTAFKDGIKPVSFRWKAVRMSSWYNLELEHLKIRFFWLFFLRGSMNIRSSCATGPLSYPEGAIFTFSWNLLCALAYLRFSAFLAFADRRI